MATRYNPDQLAAFVTAADTGSFTSAGKKLGKTQAAISQLIGNLELDLQAQLFDRSGKYPTLTDTGAALYSHAKLVIEASKGFEMKARELHSGVEHCPRIGIDPLLVSPRLTALIAELAQAYPSINLRIEETPTQQLLQGLAEGKLDMALIVELGAVPAELNSVAVASIGYQLVAAPSHPLSQPQTPVDKLKSYTQLSSPIICLSDKYEQAQRLSAQMWVIDNLEQMLDLVEAGLGWAFAPVYKTQPRIEAGGLVPLKHETLGTEGSVSVAFSWPENYTLGPAMRWLKQRLLDLGSL